MGLRTSRQCDHGGNRSDAHSAILCGFAAVHFMCIRGAVNTSSAAAHERVNYHVGFFRVPTPDGPQDLSIPEILGPFCFPHVPANTSGWRAKNPRGCPVSMCAGCQVSAQAARGFRRELLPGRSVLTTFREHVTFAAYRIGGFPILPLCRFTMFGAGDPGSYAKAMLSGSRCFTQDRL